ncbi:CCA tRNA nucleotidyltransferase [Candidatus Micrarchaeota archaeon]|nr:CCA tRNA nucleotidyltransferase [Candidatus Micrarchaeota archaeon]MBD3417845.1 CCA tRNA nucleotidyltransferase [Candidatus Micrarchaeota archaeon]
MKHAEVLKKITPSKTEASGAKKLAESTRKALKKHLPKGVKTLLAGSVAKGTFLRGAGDIDIFAIFPVSYSKEEMFKKLEKAAKKAFPRAQRETGYAEHPYLRIYLKKKRIDLVPSYKMEEGERVKSAVDRSQLHTKYVLSKMKAAQKKEVLLLKQFLKANLLYGAEIKTKGFSGYLCELMVLHYGSFEKFLKAASMWKLPVVIDQEKKYTSLRAVPDFKTPLTVIDPVDLRRNVAAVITRENLQRFMFLSAAYIAEPSEKFFFPKTMSLEELEEKTEGRNIFALVLDVPKTGLVSDKLAEDVLWGQLWRLSGQLESYLKKAEFNLLGIHPYKTDSDCVILFELRSPVLPKTQTFRGPYLDQTEHVSVFMRKRSKPFFFDHGRIHSLGKRKLWNISLAIKEFRKRKNAPSHMAGAQKAKLFAKESILEDYPEALEEYFRINWFPA